MGLLDKITPRVPNVAELIKRPAEPVAKIDPATCELALVPCVLRPRDVEAIGDIDERAYHAAATRLPPVLARLSPEPIEGSPRRRYACPVCGADDVPKAMADRRLVIQDVLDDDRVSLCCLSGCDPEAVMATLREIVVRIEKDQDRERLAAAAHAKSERDRADAIAEEESLQTAASITALSAAPAQRWCVPGFLGADMLTILGGTSGDGKTYEALHVAICVAAGVPWFGRPVEPARVLLVLLEGAVADRRARILKLARGLGVAFDDLVGRLDVYPDDLKTDNAESYATFKRYVTRLGYALVVIDNLSEIRSLHTHGAENDVATMTAVIRPLADVAHGGRAILLLHHTNAKGELRGSSAIRQHTDAVFEMERASAANDSPVTLTRTKDRTGETFETLTYRMVDDDRAGKDQRRVVPELLTKARRTSEPEAEVDPNELTPRRLALRDIVCATPGLGLNAIGRAYTERTGKNPSVRDVLGDLTWLVEDGQLARDDAKKYSPVED